MPRKNDKLRKARTDCSWSCQDVAERIGVPDYNTVSRWERGVNFPSPHYRQKLCALYGKSAEELGLDGKSYELFRKGDAESFSSLPYFSSPIIGRQSDVELIIDLLMHKGVRLLTLVGLGGIGKTRLVVEVARQIKEHYALKYVYVDLSPCNDSERLIPTIAEELGLSFNIKVSQEQQVKTFLRREKVLLILDNFESVIKAARKVADLLHSCSDCIIIVTSRERLNLNVEYVHHMLPLTLPDKDQALSLDELSNISAIAWFVELVRRTCSGFQMTTETGRLIAEICHLLDGFPLLIELAVAQMPPFSLQELFERLSQDLNMLKSDHIDVPERQRTLKGMIRWSYDRLSIEEQWLLRHLSLFSGGITLRISERFIRILGRNDIDVPAILSSLVKKSFLQSPPPGEDNSRLIMLETIRFYARENLRSEHEEVAALCAYAQCYLQLMEEVNPDLTGDRQRDRLEYLEAEFNNLRVALDWFIIQKEVESALRFADVFGKFCGLSGYWIEEQRWLEAVLDLPGVSDYPFLWARVLRRIGHLLYRLRKLSRSRELFQLSLEASRQIDDKTNLVGVLTGLGRLFYRMGDVQKAEHRMQEAMELSNQSGDNWSLGNMLECFGNFKMMQGDLDEAQRLLARAVVILREVADTDSLVRALTTLVKLDIARGNIEQAKTHALDSNRLACELGTRPLIAVTLNSLSDVYFFQGAYEDAQKYMQERIDLAYRLGDTPTVEVKRLRLVEIDLILQESNDLEQMICQVELSFYRLHDMGDPPGEIMALCVLGDLLRRVNRLEQAASRYREVLTQYPESTDNKLLGRSLAGLAFICVAQNRFECAASLFGAVELLLSPLTDMHPEQSAAYQHARKCTIDQLGKTRFSNLRLSSAQLSINDVVGIFDAR